ncbi:unnamed protein product [Adineta ricciae]|uniref:Uncharacterized protein n=2 Tax=Adineta ricciae TaxID=249248 RepID=A0A814E9N5_ADIRI|nr:unnamed protein product [Adineta ricciae]
MKYKQLCPKFLRPNPLLHKRHQRCSLCDRLLKTQRYMTVGKSVHESFAIKNEKAITYAECCRQYLKESSLVDKLHMICLKCCNNLQRVHSLHTDAEDLTEKLRQTCSKTKRLHRIRHSSAKSETDIKIKIESSPVDHVKDLPIPTSAIIPSINSAFIPPQIFSHEHQCNQPYLYPHKITNPSTIPFAQFLIDSPIATNLSHRDKQRTLSNCEQTPLDDDHSLSSYPNEDESNSKNTRLSRRQYDFLIELPDQQSLNSFIETSASESGSRWTWRRTSSNSRGYKVYYVCNFSMRRHYHPCPAAMYALFNPAGSISVYSYGQHRHIPKNHLPLIISDQTKDEIFKCLQTDMSATSIREHLIRLKLPFGDTKKLNNFIKYHRELLRFGAVTNVRVNGTAYRQPQYWAIRRSSPVNTNTTIL